MIAENEKELTNYNISKHAQKRYCERVNGYMDETSVNRFISLHSTEMRERINKLITYGDEVYEGDLKRHKGTTIFRNGNWIVVVNKKDKVVISLWEKDLGLGDDFNKEYVGKTIDKINQKKEEKERIENSNSEEKNKLKSQIENNDIKIAELALYLKGLREANDALNSVIETMDVNTKEFDNEISEMVDKLLRG